MPENRLETNAPVPMEAVPPVASPMEARIYVVRGERVMLDSDLAEVYEVETKSLNRAVSRNLSRFPERFAFQVLPEEWERLRCQIGTSNIGRGGRRYLPWVFTEHGAVMLASVLNSDRAIAASRAVVDAFVRLRALADADRALAKRIDELAAKVGEHDRTFAIVFHELRKLTVPPPDEPEKPRRRIGFKPRYE